MSENQPLQYRIQEEITELAASVNQIVTKFRELQNPLKESSEKVPIATEQLDKISEQTEAATHQMLDRVVWMRSRSVPRMVVPVTSAPLLMI
jgi:methyl-accepting chemotaxis protein